MAKCCRSAVFYKFKASHVPPEGWNSDTFSGRNGVELLRDIVKINKSATARGMRVLSKFFKAYWDRKLEELIAYVIQRGGVRKAFTIDLDVPSEGSLWAEAIEEVFKEDDMEVMAEVLPAIQSVASETYGRTMILLGADADPGANQAVLKRSKELARKVTRVNDETRKRLGAEIEKSIDEGATVYETIEILRKRFPEISANRIPTIARTEMGRASDEGIKQALKMSSTVTHVSVIGCEAIEKNSPTYKGIPTCNIENVPIEDIDMLEFHPNHTGTIVPSRFRGEDGSSKPVPTTGGNSGIESSPLSEIPNPADLEYVRELGGSNGTTRLMKDKDGELWVQKTDDAERVRSEFGADETYRAANVPVPPSKIFDEGNKATKVAKFVDGTPLNTFMRTATPEEKERVLNEIRKGFSTDALIGNWDAIGLEMDNIIVGKDGIPYRIDNGGAFKYRAQGALKGAQWNEFPIEFWTMRGQELAIGGVNQVARTVYGDYKNETGLGFFDIARQLKEMDIEAILAKVPADQRALVKARFESILNIAEKALLMEADQYKLKYVDRLGREIMELRSMGVSEKLKVKLKPHIGTTTLVDEDGVRWDGIRGRGITKQVADSIKKEYGEGAVKFVEEILESQGGSSWAPWAQAHKAFVVSQRNVPDSKYFWLHGADNAKQKLALLKKSLEVSEESVNGAMIRWHAYTQELLENTQLQNVDRKRKYVRLIRTEKKDVMRTYNQKPGAVGKIIRGANESSSLLRVVSVEGEEVTYQSVPFHRITASYITARPIDTDISTFLGDGENEFTFNGEALSFVYRKEKFKPGKEPIENHGNDMTKWNLPL